MSRHARLPGRAVTFRLGAHTTADDPGRYRTDADVEPWQKREPLIRLEKFLRERGIVDDEFAELVKTEAASKVEEAVEKAESIPPPIPSDVFEYMYEEMPRALKEQLASLTESLMQLEEVESSG